VAETRDVVQAISAERDDIEILDAPALLPGVADLGTGPFIQLWPHRHATDAMFVAVIRRTAPGIRRT
jgi:16S rRNA (cytosine967-C5)-methyltransferase